MKEPGKLEFPNLRITIPATYAEIWRRWFNEFVVRGINDETAEKTGTLSLLAPNRTEVLATIRLHRHLPAYRRSGCNNACLC